MTSLCIHKIFKALYNDLKIFGFRILHGRKITREFEGKFVKVCYESVLWNCVVKVCCESVSDSLCRTQWQEVVSDLKYRYWDKSGFVKLGTVVIIDQVATL